MTGVTQTPNIKLSLVPADFKNWTDIANGNSKLLDAIVSAYFTVQNLQGLWQNSTAYAAGDTVVDAVSSVVYKVAIAHTSAAIPTTFLQDRTAHASYWTVYSSPARSRGVWMPATSYALNDFVVSGAKYAICVQSNISGATFDGDEVLGYWDVLVDLSMVGATVLPVPGGSGDANKFTVTNPVGNGYTIVSPLQALALLGATSLGQSLLKAVSSADALSAIGAQPAGDYQPSNASLTTLSGITIGSVGAAILAMTAYTQLLAALGIAPLSGLVPGTGANNLVQLDSDGHLPALDGGALVNLVVVPQAFSINRASGVLAIDVALNNTANWFNGPTIGGWPGATQLYLNGYVTVRDTGVGSAKFLVRIIDDLGTEYMRSVGYSSPSTNDPFQISICGFLTLGGTAADTRTLTMQVKDVTAATGVILANDSGGAKDTKFDTFKTNGATSGPSG